MIETLLKPAWRNYSRNLQRYRVLLLALVLVVATLVFIAGTVLGISTTLRGKAGRYFAGDIVVLGLAGDGGSIITHPDEVRAAVTELPRLGIPLLTWSQRSTYYDPQNAALFHAGNHARQRRIVGVEWELERPVLRRFDFTAGGVPPAGEENAVLISTATADLLDARVGDRITVSVISSRGRSNTADLLVHGVFDEAGFFGFTTYLHRRALNLLLEQPADQVNEIGVYLADPLADEAIAAERLTRAIAENLPTFPVLTERAAYQAAVAARREQREYGVVTLNAQLQEINDLLAAISIIAATVIALFLSVVVVGVSNTYSMIVFERTAEIGTLRALGMQKRRMVALFLWESLFLALSGAMLGLGLGLGALHAVGTLADFSDRSWAVLFLQSGRLNWYLPPSVVAAIAAVAVIAGVTGCLRAALRAAAINPADALRTD